ncbi:putative phosphatase phospho1 [Dirofilaria immitis]
MTGFEKKRREEKTRKGIDEVEGKVNGCPTYPSPSHNNGKQCGGELAYRLEAYGILCHVLLKEKYNNRVAEKQSKPWSIIGPLNEIVDNFLKTITISPVDVSFNPKTFGIILKK